MPLKVTEKKKRQGWKLSTVSWMILCSMYMVNIDSKKVKIANTQDILASEEICACEIEQLIEMF